MSSLPRPPASSADLDLAVVERVLANTMAISLESARELGVSGPDLKRLTWAKPWLVENAMEEYELAVIMAQSVIISALDSPDWRRRAWACEKIMGSYLARDHLLAPARRGRSPNVGESRSDLSLGRRRGDGRA